MVAFSQFLAPKMASGTCEKVLHPWTDSCFRAYWDVLRDSIAGSMGFLFLMYFFQYLVKIIKKTNQKPDKNFMLESIKNYLRSLFFCSQISSLSILSSCLLRKLFGRFYYYSMIWIPTIVGGFFAILPESPQNKEFFTITWANLSLEVWIRQLERSKILRWSANQKTVIFMILSATLSYCFHKDLPDQRYFWFYVPKKPNLNEKASVHDDVCQRRLFAQFVRYFTIGFGIQFLKNIFIYIAKPESLLCSLLHYETYKLGAFSGFYVLIYESIRCFLFRTEKKFSNYHDIISGFLAGSAFCFYPNINIFNTAIITIIQILGRLGCHKNILPRLPYTELTFAFCTGLLFNTGFLTPKQNSMLMNYMMSACTNKRYETATRNFQNLLKE